MVIDEQKYRSIARELRKEKKLLAQLMTHCHTRYAYAPVYDAMEKGANAILPLFFSLFMKFLKFLFKLRQGLDLIRQTSTQHRSRVESVVGLDIELPAVFRTIQRRPDRLLLSGTAVCLTQRLCTPVNPELSCMAKLLGRGEHDTFETASKNSSMAFAPFSIASYTGA